MHIFCWNIHQPALAHPVTPVLCLLIIVWIEVDVMQYNGVGSRQVDAEATSPCGQQEHKDLRTAVVPVNQLLPATQKMSNMITATMQE